jgi:SAM-dependent methyltransferase
MSPTNLERAALRGEPSYLWRAGQHRRLEMILKGGSDRVDGIILDNGCGVGQYLRHLAERARLAIGLEYEHEHAQVARNLALNVVRAAAEQLPYPEGTIDLVLSHEVLEHVSDDRRALEEITRVMRQPHPKKGIKAGRLVLFVPNRGYPFETHGIYWRDRYHFGNIPLINYLPRFLRDRLAPHVRVYSRRDLEKLLQGLPLQVIHRTVIFGAYDNIIARQPALGRMLRGFLQALERTPLCSFGLSHVWVIERKTGDWRSAPASSTLGGRS